MQITGIFAAILAVTPISTSTDRPSVLDVLNCKVDSGSWADIRARIDVISGATAAAKSTSDSNANSIFGADLTFYTLPEPITFLGHQTQTIASSEDGFFAVLNTSDRSGLAIKLGIDPEKAAPYSVAVDVPGEKYQSAGDVGGSFLGEREAYNRKVVKISDGPRYYQRAVHIVFDTNDSPSVSYAGCKYFEGLDTSGL